MNAAALKLILICTLLLTYCDARGNNSGNSSTDNSTAGLFLWPATDEVPAAQHIEDAYYSMGTEHLYGKTSYLPLRLAYLVEDLSGDSISDFLFLNLAIDQVNDSIVSVISAMSGSDGETIWQKDYQDA